LSNDFKKFLEDEGIALQLSVEYTPQQNGVAERANRTIVEMARCMLQQSGLLQSLWAEAVSTATFIRNRCPTKYLNDKTPFEAWTNNKSYVGFFRISGSKVIALNKGPKRGKFLQKGDKYILVGYSEESKAYRLWKPGTRRVIKSRDVKFYEKVYPCNVKWDALIEVPNDPTNSKENGASKIKLPLLKDIHDSKNEEITNDHDQQFEEDNAQEEIDNSLDDNEDDEENISSSQHDRGRLKLLKTGRPGRPKKIYRKDANHDLLNVNEAINRDDRSD